MEMEDSAPTGVQRPQYPAAKWLAKLHTHSRVLMDAVLALAILLVTAAFAIQNDALKKLIEWSEQYEDYEIDEIFTVLIIASVVLLLFSVRRLQDLHHEARERNATEKRYRRIRNRSKWPFRHLVPMAVAVSHAVLLAGRSHHAPLSCGHHRGRAHVAF